MVSYNINTKKYNIFTGTRAEAITKDIGTKERTIVGILTYVLPATATLKDIDRTFDTKAKIRIDMNDIAPDEILRLQMSQKKVYLELLKKLYNVRVSTLPVTDDPLIIVMNATTEFTQNFRDQYSATDLPQLLRSFADSPKVFTYSGNCVANPKDKIVRGIKRYADRIWNCKNHSAFFDPCFTELVEDEEPNEIVLVGGDLADQLFYTAIDAVDLDSKPMVTVLKDRVMCSKTEQATVKNTITEHLEQILDAELISDSGLYSLGGLTVYLK